MGSMITANYDSETDQIIDASPRLNNGVANSSVPVTATLSDQGVEIATDAPVGRVSLPYALRFPDFVKSILASFVAGTTAAQSGNTVTVTATAHGIVGNTTKNGYRIYWPGSPSIPAGWYSSFAYVDVNTITFQRATSATVASESMNAGAAYLSTQTVCSVILPGKSMGPLGSVRVTVSRGGDTSANFKQIKTFLSGVNMNTWTLAAFPWGLGNLTFCNNGLENSQVAILAVDGGSGSGSVQQNIDTTVAQTLSVGMVVQAAGQFAVLENAWAEVTKLG